MEINPFSRRKVLPFNPSLPVPVAGVEKRPLPEQYLVGGVQERGDDDTLCLIGNDNESYELQPDLLSFGTQGGLWQKEAHFNDYSFRCGHSWRAGRYARPWLKTNLKFSGTYDMNGELTIIAEEKGIYIDQFS